VTIFKITRLNIREVTFMETTGQDLMHEHKAILIALDVMEKMHERVQNDKEMNSEDIKEILDFLRVFADKCHHGKEEGILFPALQDAGILKQEGPIELMLAQHAQGRKLIRRMQTSIENKPIDKHAFIFAASSYVNLLRNHREKEDTMLFPLSDAKLSAEMQKKLLVKFENLEKNVIGEGRHEALHKTLDKLSRKYLQ